jgi:hypothetical protein
VKCPLPLHHFSEPTHCYTDVKRTLPCSHTSFEGPSHSIVSSSACSHGGARYVIRSSCALSCGRTQVARLDCTPSGTRAEQSLSEWHRKNEVLLLLCDGVRSGKGFRQCFALGELWNSLGIDSKQLRGTSGGWEVADRGGQHALGCAVRSLAQAKQECSTVVQLTSEPSIVNAPALGF